MRPVSFTTVVLIAGITPAAAAPVDLTGRAVAATCSNCHTAGGQRAIPPLEGRPAGELTAALEGFRSGLRAGTVMPQLAKGYTDAEIAAVARWYATQKPASTP